MKLLVLIAHANRMLLETISKGQPSRPNNKLQRLVVVILTTLPDNSLLVIPSLIRATNTSIKFIILLWIIMETWKSMSNWTQFRRSKCKSDSSCKNFHLLVRTKMIVTTITHCCSANTIHRRLSQHSMLTKIMIMTMMEIMREIIISSVMRILL